MNRRKLGRILSAVESGKLSVKDALSELRDLPYEDLSHAKIDHHRSLRQGIPEVILARGKSPDDIASIAAAMYKKSGAFLVTKASEDVYAAVKSSIPARKLHYYPRSGVIAVGSAGRKKGLVTVVSAGTSDIPISEEASVTASFLGSRVEEVLDVGVAGLHRLMHNIDALRKARAVIVVAGMEGALPSVVGGVTDRPIIAVPTSVGYGSSLDGLTALFAMLNSCVPGIAVMNIDNGFGAGCLAHKINSL